MMVWNFNYLNAIDSNNIPHPSQYYQVIAH